jgi:hypothetical protein
MEWSSFTRDFEGKVYKKAQEMDTSHLKDPSENLGSLLTGNFKRYLEGSGKGASFFVGAVLEGLLSGDLEGYGEDGSGDEHVCSPGTLRDS